MAKMLSFLLVLCGTHNPHTADLPLVFSDDFSDGAAEWEATDEKAWKITVSDGGNVYENPGGSRYDPPYRSPKNISLRKDKIVGDFVLTAKVRTTKEAYGHRNMCLFFGYQDPANFHYIHLGEKKDPHANQILLVNEAPRIAISEKASDGTPWKEAAWHDVKVVRDVSSGLIEVYFDDMETPTHVAHDKTFTWGRVGVGTFDDKVAFYKEQFTPENSVASAHRVEDYNGDGVHDIQDLTALTERIRPIADTDGDGIADEMHTYAEDMDHLIGGVAGGVLHFDGDVYASPVPELLRFRDTDGDDKADQREVLVSGFGVHLAYAVHDMHGLSVGPDGRIYWSVGDKGIRVKTADGLDYRFPNQGGLMRCEPDGSNFEVFAHGQRNIQEVAFDNYGNFFGVDNDADFTGERERFVHIEQYMDTGWRSNWQYLRDDYNPWDDELMHVPWHDEQARWFTPPLSNYENGPAGFKMNPGTELSPEYRDYFFLTSAPRGEQWAFQIKPKGDAKRGRSVFMNHAAAQCIHKVKDGKGSDVGPNLKEIGKKKEEPLYILESLIDPQKVVTKGYGNISLTLEDGSSVAGQFREEEKGHVVLRDAENKETRIPVGRIAGRSEVVSTMPPMGFILAKHELRDVMAHLTSLGK